MWQAVDSMGYTGTRYIYSNAQSILMILIRA